ncbi:cell division protein ZipA [Gammaproteobacteria bacterium 54_18_T64]|nr:cell division protein ZipA [Gammaproteobacteria bacterium 54_18_T64]
MDLGSREILLALGALLIVAILLDGLRRVRSAGRGKLRVKRRRQPIFDDDDFDEFGSELPNGKARVVGFRDQGSAAELSQTIKANRESDSSRLTSPFRESESELVDPELVDPELVDPELSEYQSAEFDGSEVVTEPALESHEGEAMLYGDSALDPEPPVETREETQISLFKDDASANDKALELEDGSLGQDPVDQAIVVPALEPQKKSRRGKTLKDVYSRSRGSKGKAGSASAQVAAANGEDVVILHLMAESGREFGGEDLLKAVVDNGMRYGSLKVFHRHMREDGSGDVLFSMANAVNPGTFELNTMGEFSTPGVTFMMVLDDSEEPLATFDLMLACIHGVNSAIGGQLQDQQRSALSRQTAEHYRQQIMDFNRRRLTASV